MATVLQIITNAAAEAGVAVGSSVTSNDLTMTRMRFLLNRVGKDMRRKAQWPETLKATLLFIQANTSLYAPPPDLDTIANNTFWDNDEDAWAYGPISPSDFTEITYSNGYNALQKAFRIVGWGRQIQLTPMPSETNYFAYQYYSKNWLRPQTAWTQGSAIAAGTYFYDSYYGLDTVYEKLTTGIISQPTPFFMYQGGMGGVGYGVDYKEVAYDTIVGNGDVAVLDEEILTIGLIARFLDGKGVDATKYIVEYERMISDRVGQISGAGIIRTTPASGSIWASKEKNMPIKLVI